MRKGILLIAFCFLSLSTLADHYPINYSIEVKHYRFEIRLSDKTDEIQASSSITVLVIKEGLTDLAIDLIQKTDERKGLGMILDSVKLDGKPISYQYSEDKVKIHLEKSPALGKEILIQIAYHGIPKEGLIIGKTQFGKRSFFSDNWPNKARNWLATFDHPYYKSTSEMIIKAPIHYQVISNGLLQEETNLDSLTKLTHWKQSVPVSNWLFDLGVADFAVQYYDTFEGKSLSTWVFPENKEAGFYDFPEATKKSVQFFSDYIGPYEYEKIANVQTASVAGGMEASSAIFYAQNLVTGKRSVRIRNVVIHELAHQWFGNSVTEKTWDDVWLSEGFATFFTLRYIENEYGKEEYIKGLLNAKRTIYQTAKKLPGFKIIEDKNPEIAEITSALTYQKGAWTLHMLRNLIGEENFHKGIRAYYAKYRNNHVSTQDFQDEMEKASGMKLGGFLDQWLRHPENPELKGSWAYDAQTKKLKIHLEQIQAGEWLFKFPLEIGVYQKGNPLPLILKMNIKDKSFDQSFSIPESPDKIEFDPRTLLLANITWENPN